MKVSDYLVNQLLNIGVKTVFGYTGGNITCIIDSIGRTAGIKFVQNYHEQASAFSANAYAKITQNIGVAIASSGPGAINLISGIANAYYDSIPCLFITGNVSSLTVSKNSNIRQSGFQENDIVQMVQGITKFCIKIENPNEISYYLEKAIFYATHGRKGPVLLDIPHDIQYADVDIKRMPHYVPEGRQRVFRFKMEEYMPMILNAKAPLILVGGGADSKQSKLLLRKVLLKYKIPVVASLCGLSVLNHNHECFVGFIGAYGNRYANLALRYCDLLLVLGSRMDERQIGGNLDSFAPDADIIHIDIDKNELHNVVKREIGLNCSVETFLSEFIEQTGTDSIEYREWNEILAVWKKRFSVDISSYGVHSFFKYLSSFSDSSVVCADVGNHQMCVAQSYSFNCDEGALLNSGGLGAMGYALPAAIGAYFALDDARVICITGDGGMQMNLQELQTIKREGLPIKIIIINNQSLGMIEAYQQNVFSGRLFASVEGYSVPDFEKIAAAYEIPYIKVKDISGYSRAKQAMLESEDSVIIEFVATIGMRTYPIPGKSIIEQFPQLNDEELSKIRKEASI